MADKHPITETAYSFVMTAFIMTCFEVAFAYFVAFPGIQRSVRYQLDRMKTARKHQNDSVDEIDEVILVMKQRERDNMDRINQHSIVFASILIASLAGALLALRFSMRSTKVSSEPAMLSLLTVVALMPFQVCFYLMALPSTSRWTWLPDFVKNAPSWKFDDIAVHMEESIVQACADASVAAPEVASIFDNEWPTL